MAPVPDSGIAAMNNTPASEIRRITPADREALTDFFARNDQPQVTRHFHPFPLNADTANTLSLWKGKDCFLGLFVEQTMIGFAMLRGWDEGYEVPSFGILIDHPETGKGWGRKLSLRAIEQANELGAAKVRLSVYASNAAAVALYESLGFTERERQSLLHDGHPDARLIMIKELSTP